MQKKHHIEVSALLLSLTKVRLNELLSGIMRFLGIRLGSLSLLLQDCLCACLKVITFTIASRFTSMIG